MGTGTANASPPDVHKHKECNPVPELCDASPVVIPEYAYVLTPRHYPFVSSCRVKRLSLLTVWFQCQCRMLFDSVVTGLLLPTDHSSQPYEHAEFHHVGTHQHMHVRHRKCRVTHSVPMRVTSGRLQTLVERNGVLSARISSASLHGTGYSL